MKPLFRQIPKPCTPENANESIQTEVDTLNDAIVLFQNANTGSLDVSILMWEGSNDGYIIYASTSLNIPIPENPTE